MTLMAFDVNRPFEQGLESLLYVPPTHFSGLALQAANGEVYSDGNIEDEHQLPAIKRYVLNYHNGEGKTLARYLHQEHGREIRVNRIGSTKLPDHVVAAIASNKYFNTLLANRDFEGKVNKLATNYRLSFEEGMRYVLSHEMVHAAGVHSEVETEQTLARYFTQQARNYRKLAENSSGDAQKDHQQTAASYHRLAGAAKTRAAMGEYTLQGKNAPAKSYQAAGKN